jgi:hypothetical protein
MPTPIENDLLHRFVVAHAESDQTLFQNIDSKAGMVLGFALVTIAELLGFLLLVVAEGRILKMSHPHLVSALFWAGMVFLIGGSVSATLALYPRPFFSGIAIRSIDANNPLTLEGLLQLINTMKTTNAPYLKKKHLMTRVASVLVPAGLLCLAFVVLLLFSSLTS